MSEKQKLYQKMFDDLAKIGIKLAKDYPDKQKIFEAFDVVANFVGDVAKGRIKEKSNEKR